MHFKNCIKKFIVPIKTLYELDFKKKLTSFLYCTLMPKIIVGMNPITSFVPLNWNELKLNF